MTPLRIMRRIGIWTPAALALIAAAGTAAQTQAPMFPGGAPKPPTRPSSMATGAPPAAPAESPRPAPPPPTALDDYTPVTLPQASRARMHECGLEWERMQKSGATANILWRDFAGACLTRPDGTPPTKTVSKK